MDKSNLDDHCIYYSWQESFRRNGIALIVNNRIWNVVLGYNLKNDRINLPPPSPDHPSGSSQCTSPEHPVSCIDPGPAIRFTYGIKDVSIPFSQIIPPSPSPTESKSLFCTSASLLLSRIQSYRYHLSKFHIYVLVHCIGVCFFFLAYFTLYNQLQFHPPH